MPNLAMESQAYSSIMHSVKWEKKGLLFFAKAVQVLGGSKYNNESYLVLQFTEHLQQYYLFCCVVTLKLYTMKLWIYQNLHCLRTELYQAQVQRSLHNKITLQLL